MEEDTTQDRGCLWKASWRRGGSGLSEWVGFGQKKRLVEGKPDGRRSTKEYTETGSSV